MAARLDLSPQLWSDYQRLEDIHRELEEEHRELNEKWKALLAKKTESAPASQPLPPVATLPVPVSPVISPVAAVGPDFRTLNTSLQAMIDELNAKLREKMSSGRELDTLNANLQAKIDELSAKLREKISPGRDLDFEKTFPEQAAELSHCRAELAKKDEQLSKKEKDELELNKKLRKAKDELFHLEKVRSKHGG